MTTQESKSPIFTGPNWRFPVSADFSELRLLLTGGQGVVGSNPAIPTNTAIEIQPPARAAVFIGSAQMGRPQHRATYVADSGRLYCRTHRGGVLDYALVRGR